MDSSKACNSNLELRTIASEQHGTHLFVTDEDFCKWRRQNLSRYIGSTFNDIKDELEEKFGAKFINYYARHIRMWLARKKQRHPSKYSNLIQINIAKGNNKRKAQKEKINQISDQNFDKQFNKLKEKYKKLDKYVEEIDEVRYDCYKKQKKSINQVKEFFYKDLQPRINELMQINADFEARIQEQSQTISELSKKANEQEIQLQQLNQAMAGTIKNVTLLFSLQKSRSYSTDNSFSP